MNNTILNYLEDLDLSDIEAKLYLMLLKTGPTSVRDLAEKIEIKRTTAYLYIDQLIERGLIMKVVKGSEKLIAANDPEESLANLVDEKLKKAKTIQNEFPAMLQSITTSIPDIKDVGEAEIKYYKGINGIQKIYEEALNATELRSYIKLIEEENVFPNNVSMFIHAFKKNPQLKIKEIFYDSPFSRREAQKIASSTDRYSYKFLPKNMNLSSEDILIFDGKVGIIHYKDKKNSSSVILKSLEYYNNSKELFDFIWKTIPEEK